MSKRRNRELREREAAYRLSHDPHYIAGALASGVPADINPALAPVDRNPEGGNEVPSRSDESAVTAKPAGAQGGDA